MEFLIVFGTVILIISMVVRLTVKFEVNPNSTCISNEIKQVKSNKINFYIFLGLGSICLLIGIILAFIL